MFFILYNTRPHEHCAFRNDDDDDDDVDDDDDDNDVIDDDDDDNDVIDDDDDDNDDCVGSGGVEVTPIKVKIKDGNGTRNPRVINERFVLVM